jgi:CheY-like chemotaxis protein
MDDLLRQSIGQGVRLAVRVLERPLWASTDSGQLEFAILNLALNARDAMPDGGDLVIEAGPAPTADQVTVSVRDSGHGMDRAVADRALEPFFSTKSPDKGTGLGLAQVYGAVRQSGGQIDIVSAPGQGTTVRLLLPRSAAPAVVDNPAQAAAVAGSGATVLVVDDEVDVRAIMAEALAEAGYSVEQAPDGRQALQALRSQRFDLLVTDFAMPGMNGAELASQARQLWPDQRVLIVSGYADTQAISSANLRAALVVKPLDVRALRTAVAAALAA